MRRIKLTIQYIGSNYSGWQYQDNADTVQKRLQDALSRIVNHPVTLHGIGRTDEGVHAEKFFAHFDTESTVDLGKIVLGANRYLPNDISVLDAEDVDESFDARYSAVSKTYRYSMYVSRSRIPMLDINCFQIYKKVDLDKMRQAATLLVGEKDFAAFQSTGSNLVGTVRRVYAVDIRDYERDGIERIDIYVKGNAFLYNMVRNIAGVLLWIGQGKLLQEDLSEMLVTGARKKHFKTLPGHGLTMVDAEYR